METTKIIKGILHTYKDGKLISRKGKRFLEVFSYSGWKSYCMRIKI